jgi:photosynthetic reaction center cytochrome c subunit
MQTGPRGTGMHVSEFVADLAEYPDVEGFVTSEPIVPTAGAALAASTSLKGCPRRSPT